MGGRNTRTRVSEPIHGLSGRIRTLQRGEINATSLGNFDAAVTAVVLAKSYVEGGKGNSSDASASRAASSPYATSPTNVRVSATSGGTALLTTFELIEEW